MMFLIQFSKQEQVWAVFMANPTHRIVSLTPQSCKKARVQFGVLGMGNVDL